MTIPFTASLGFGTGIGYALSLVLFILDQISGKRSSHEIFREQESDRTIRDYLEWLRRQNHDALIRRINANEDMLLRELGSLGTDVQGLSARVLRELRETRDEIGERIRDLNTRFATPVLSPVPLRSRPLTTVPLLSRENEIAWLQETANDVVISGQPGSGKTYLVYHFAQQCSGRFVLTKNPDTAVSAVLNGCPPVLIVDDAASQGDLIRRLIHVRNEQSLRFRLIAICWPFELDDVLNAMELPKASALELPLLTRAVIAKLIQLVIQDAGYQAPNDIVREINNQAVGRPGLAVALTLASLQEDLQAVMRGETLAQTMGRLFESIVGGKAAQIMAAFSVGGKSGMELEAVSQTMDIPILELHAALKEMAPGGVLEPISRTRLLATPRAMRRAILKEVFFRDKGICLPFSVYEALLAAAPDREEAVHALLESVHVDAVVDHSWLQRLVTECRSPKVWEAFASLGASQCRYVIDHHPEMEPYVIDVALHYLPSIIIPHMLDRAVKDVGTPNGHPEGPLRKLADWVSHARAGTPDTVQRRRDLLEAIKVWVNAGGDRNIAYRALKPCFALGYEMQDTDPGDGMKVTFSSGLLPLDDIDAIAALWPDFLGVASQHGIPDWKPVISMVSEYLHPHSRFGRPGGEEYRCRTIPLAKRFVEDLVSLCNRHNGFLRWAYMNATEAGIDPSTIPVDEEYLRLYPIGNLSQDWKEKEKENVKNAGALADAWKDLTFTEIIARLQRYETEAASMDNSWPRLSPYVSQRLAERRAVSEQDVLALIASGVPADLVAPFLVVSFEHGMAMNAALRDCISRDGYRHLAVYHTLLGQSPQLYPEIAARLPAYTEYMEHLAYRGNIPEDIMRALLTHDDKRVRLAAALLEFRSESEGQVRGDIKPEWRSAIAEGMTEYENARDLRHIHDLDRILAYDRSLAYEVLMGMANRADCSLSMWDLEPVMPLFSVLNREERLSLLDACEGLFMTEIPKVLIGNDYELYRQFLARPEMRQHHLTPLVGSPSDDGWIDKALIALDAGYKAMEVAQAARGHHWSWCGPKSQMWQKWIDAFRPLLDHEDPRMQEIGRASMKMSTAARDEALRNENREDIFGRFGD